jgi:hypothetical protein
MNAQYIAKGLVLGGGIGTVLSIAMDSLSMPMGIGFGGGFGLVLGLLISSLNRKNA